MNIETKTVGILFIGVNYMAKIGMKDLRELASM